MPPAVAITTGTLPESAVAVVAKPLAAERGKLGLGLLVALVVGSIVGSGILGLPQNMAAGAGTGAIVIDWSITGVGMLMLALTYQMLAVRKPDLDNGVYESEREQWGEGNNLLCNAPGVVMAYDHNVYTNTLLLKAGIEVITMPSSELGRGRGGQPLHELPDRTRRPVTQARARQPVAARKAPADGYGGSGA